MLLTVFRKPDDRRDLSHGHFVFDSTSKTPWFFARGNLYRTLTIMIETSGSRFHVTKHLNASVSHSNSVGIEKVVSRSGDSQFLQLLTCANGFNEEFNCTTSFHHKKVSTNPTFYFTQVFELLQSVFQVRRKTFVLCYWVVYSRQSS